MQEGFDVCYQRAYLKLCLQRFIFTEDLITNTAELLDSLLDLCDELCRDWCSEELLTALLEALTQLGSVPILLYIALLHNIGYIVDFIECSARCESLSLSFSSRKVN